MTKYQFTKEDYASIVKAVRESDDWRDEGIREYLTLELERPNVLMISLTRLVDGHWENGVSTNDPIRGYEEEPKLYVVDKDTYFVTSFELFDEDGNDQDNDFDKCHLCEILNNPRRVKINKPASKHMTFTPSVKAYCA